MRRFLLGSLFAAMIILGLGSPTPALAHDAQSLSSQGTSDDERDARSEAEQLTGELKTAGNRPTKGPSVQAAVAGKAERRRQLINQLASTSPSAVLDLALSPAERAALPASIQSLVEQRVTVDGELQVLHVDFEDGHSAYDAKLVKGGQETPLHFGASLGQAQPGDKVSTSGVALSGKPDVVTDRMVVVQGGTSAIPTGNQRTAIILVTEPGVASHPYANKTSTASVFFSSTTGQSARAFYTEASYGQMTIVGGSGAEGTAADVFGPYSIADTSCGSSAIRDQALAAADPEINFNSYDRVVISIASTNCGNGGIGTIRSQSVGTYDGAGQRLSLSWDFGNALGSTALNGKVGGVALHEYGHNLGVWHANALECGSVAIGSGGCASDEYGDPSDVMGNAGGYGHPNGVHKDILGWVAGRAQVAAASGSYTVFPYEDASVNAKVVKVPRTRDALGNVTGYYYLEYRKPTLTWNGFLSGRADYGNGILVHTTGSTSLCTSVCNPDFSGDGGGGDSNIIDTQPGSVAGTNDFRDAPLLAGETYVDAGAGVTLQVTSVTATGATVSVTLTAPRPAIQTIVFPEGAGTVAGAGVFSVGQSVTLTAAPGNCFVRWRENRSNQSYPNPYTFAVTADRTLEAVYSGTTCSPPPANDTFPGTTVSSGQQSVVTTGATLQSGEPSAFTCDAGPITVGRSAWYSITPAASGQLTLSTAGSSFDTVLAVYTGSAVNALTPVACNDDSPTDSTSQVQLAAQAGTTYRVQLSGFGADGGNAILSVSVAVPDADPRQEGPIQIGGSTALGGTATFTVAVKNYGSVATPAIHPFIDGVTSIGGSWRADGSQPASAVIQPGQTVTFTVHQPLTTAGTWTSTGVWLWNNDTNTVWRALPANGQSQQVSVQVAMICSPRPPITVRTALSGDGRLAVTVTVSGQELGNRLSGLTFATDARTPTTNALIDLPGVGTGRSAPATVSLPGVPGSYTFYLRRQSPGVPVTLPVTVTDGCGQWQTMVGGGTGAGF